MTISTKTSEQFENWLKGRIRTSRTPLFASFETTWRCNFRCGHCYLQGSRPRGPELDEAGALQVLDALAEEGCLSLLLTGGEPLTRPDIAVIVRHAVRRGFLVTLFTNGSLIDKRLADSLARFPPRHVEISLYGADEDTYRIVTGTAGSFHRVLAGLDLLLERGLEVKLKAVLLGELIDHVEMMQRLAAERGIELILDSRVDPALTQDRVPTRHRSDPERAMRLELSDATRRSRLRAYDEQCLSRGSVQVWEGCGAGHWALHMDPTGRIMPCVMLRTPAIDVFARGLHRAWLDLGSARRPAFEPQAVCYRCEVQHLCGFCPAISELEQSPGQQQVEYYCQLARARAAVLREDSSSAGGGALG